MKKIIVPVDFSEHSEYALKTAAKLAKKHDAEVLALHMLEMSTEALSVSDELLGQKAVFFMKLAEKKFNDFLDKDYLEGVKITPIIKHLKVFSEVNDVAKQHDADIIVMGSHGANGFGGNKVHDSASFGIQTLDACFQVLVLSPQISKLNHRKPALQLGYNQNNDDQSQHPSMQFYLRLHLIELPQPSVNT